VLIVPLLRAEAIRAQKQRRHRTALAEFLEIQQLV